MAELKMKEMLQKLIDKSLWQQKKLFEGIVDLNRESQQDFESR